MDTPDRHVPSGPPPAPEIGPIAQSVALGFRAMYVAAGLLALFWLTSSVRVIASDSQVVVRRFGRIVRTQPSGLVVAWPRPIEQVQILPGPERQLSMDVSVPPSPSKMYEDVIGATNQSAGAGAYMTGDGNVVLLTAKLTYRIKNPIAYSLEESHVRPALDRLFRASAGRITAGRNLNDFMVVQSNENPSDNGQNLLSAVRQSLLRSMRDRLAALEDSGTDLGVEIERIDLIPSLPPVAQAAFDQVLQATQTADQGIAVASTDAEGRRQMANSEADRLVSSATATATEIVSKAQVDTATILALARDGGTAQNRNSLMLRQYRAQISNIMNHAGNVRGVDPNGVTKDILPAGGQQ